MRRTPWSRQNLSSTECCASAKSWTTALAPEATVRWVREHAFATVRGNHGQAVGLDEDCRSAPLFRRLESPVWISSHGNEAEDHPKALTDEERQFLGFPPLQRELALDGSRLGNPTVSGADARAPFSHSRNRD